MARHGLFNFYIAFTAPAAWKPPNYELPCSKPQIGRLLITALHGLLDPETTIFKIQGTKPALLEGMA